MNDSFQNYLLFKVEGILNGIFLMTLQKNYFIHNIITSTQGYF